MNWLWSFILGIGEFFGWLKAREENKTRDSTVRERDLAQVADAQNRARTDVSTGDTQAITRETDSVTEAAGNETVPGVQEQMREKDAELRQGDTKAMKVRLQGLLLAACVLGLVTGCATPPPVIPPALTWEVKILAIDGQDYVAVPKAVYSRMLDRLIYLRELEKQGRIRQ